MLIKCDMCEKVEEMNQEMFNYSEEQKAKAAEFQRAAYEMGRSIEGTKDKFDEHSYCEGVIKGRNEAWECARKIMDSPISGVLTTDQLYEIFGCYCRTKILNEFTAYDAISKIKLYEEKERKTEEREIISLAKEKAKLMADKLDNDQTAKEFLKWYRSNIGR